MSNKTPERPPGAYVATIGAEQFIRFDAALVEVRARRGEEYATKLRHLAIAATQIIDTQALLTTLNLPQIADALTNAQKHMSELARLTGLQASDVFTCVEAMCDDSAEAVERLGTNVIPMNRKPIREH